MNLNTAVAQMFAPARGPGRVGAEVELITVTGATRPRPADPAVLAAGFDPGFVSAASPTFEPGGQLELSPPPRPSAVALVRDLGQLLRRAVTIAAARGAPGPRAIARAAAVMAGSMVAVAVAPTVPVAIAGLAGVGLSWSLVLVSVIAVLQSADPRMLGRVMSLFAVVLLGGTAAGGPIAASVAATIGPRAPFLVGAGAAIVAIVITGAYRRELVPACQAPAPTHPRTLGSLRARKAGVGVPGRESQGEADRGALQGHGAIVTDHRGAELGDRLVGPGFEDLHAAGNDVTRADGRREVPVHVEKHGPRAGQALRDHRVEDGAGYPALDDDLAEP
jgi:hypothetical protein